MCSDRLHILLAFFSINSCETIVILFDFSKAIGGTNLDDFIKGFGVKAVLHFLLRERLENVAIPPEYCYINFFEPNHTPVIYSLLKAKRITYVICLNFHSLRLPFESN